jgi:hypothetical protein
MIEKLMRHDNSPCSLLFALCALLFALCALRFAIEKKK